MNLRKCCNILLFSPVYIRKQQCPCKPKNNSFWGFYGADEPLVAETLFEAVLRCFEHKKSLPTKG
jgi:hypothetical protein